DEIVPLSHGRALFEAAPDPKRMRVFPGLGHNDVVTVAGAELARELASWTEEMDARPTAG
ncbi:MAG: alpha/beta hydrolase, partial [Gammaproteobacteria bacterium]